MSVTHDPESPIMKFLARVVFKICNSQSSTRTTQLQQMSAGNKQKEKGYPSIYMLIFNCVLGKSSIE